MFKLRDRQHRQIHDLRIHRNEPANHHQLKDFEDRLPSEQSGDGFLAHLARRNRLHLGNPERKAPARKHLLKRLGVQFEENIKANEDRISTDLKD